MTHPAHTTLAALADRLGELAPLAADARAAVEGSDARAAMGVAAATEPILRDALALIAAAVVLHRRVG
jgi:hypothetical protein